MSACDKKYRWANRALSVFGIVLIVVLLGGCAINRVFIPEVHRVRPGESLSSIAAEYGLNWHNLARWNGIKSPYTIHVGQRLSLDAFPPLNYAHMGRDRQKGHAERGSRSRKSRQPTPRSTVTAMPANPGPKVTRLSSRQQPKWQMDGRSGVVNIASANLPEPAASPTTHNADGTGKDKSDKPVDQQQSRQASAPPPLVSPEGWRWPLASSVLKGHDAKSIRHGINLFGIAGAPVYAARAGKVVYSGVGLQGFGQLVIIQHEGEYLSAYSYMKQVQVKEGERITAGEHIANMGIGPGSRAVLHFEIRHEGEPIDPTSVLPELSAGN